MVENEQVVGNSSSTMEALMLTEECLMTEDSFEQIEQLYPRSDSTSE